MYMHRILEDPKGPYYGQSMTLWRICSGGHGHHNCNCMYWMLGLLYDWSVIV